MFLVFFFQAEDGIRDRTVTGVQTCALPISPGHHMVIRASNRLHRLTRALRTREFVDVTDAEIVATIARENGLTPEASSAPSVRYDHVYQQNQTDLDFLLVRAARIGFNVWCEDTTLFFRKAE